ncbi:MAG: hypothetical protein B6I17_02545 [Tenericutes bacterium 4572_104]|nr:MAG: hypothetical protein B6I17_02545 [Tenericutes bacterium 4572_104]
MATKNTLTKRERIRKMTVLAMFIAIIVIMAFVPWLGFIPVFGVSATIIHIPVLIGGILLGRKPAIILATIFGVVSLIRGAMSGGFDFIFIFPWVSILPRFLFGLAIYDVYRLFSKIIKQRIIAIAVSFFLLSLLHSILVLPMMVATFPMIISNANFSSIVGGDVLTLMKGTDTLGLALKLIWGVLITNGIIEAVLAAVIGGIVADRLFVYLKFNNSNSLLTE